MRVEKQSSKGAEGRGFHHFFDWNVKSSKNVDSRIPNLSAQQKPETSIDTDTQITQYHPVIEDCTTSSLTYEDDYGKSPGVVARLMGLDSFPVSSLTDTQSKSKSTRFIDTQPWQNSSDLHVREIPEFEQKDHLQVEQKHKIIQKFQTEILPQKSARSYPVTRHKLLSPIKSPGSISSKDPARLMEAASRIPLVGPSSVDFSIRKPSSTKPVESNAARKLKGQSMNKSWDGCLEQKEGKKSVSLAIQAKVNVKRREGLTSAGAKSITVQPIAEKNIIKKPAANRVLKQNSKKQNCTDKGKSAVKSSVLSMNTQSRKGVSDKSLTVIPANKMVDRRKRVTEDVKSRSCVKHDRNGKAAAKSNGLDIVSFTFTSPISGSTGKISRNSMNSATGGDYLSTNLDQKLTAFQESRINRTIIFEDKGNRERISKDELWSKFPSNDAQVLQTDNTKGLCVTRLQQVNYMKVLVGRLLLPPLGKLWTNFVISDSLGPKVKYGQTTRTFHLTAREFSAVFSNKPKPELVDTASASPKSERSYVNDILSNIESMFEDFTLNITSKIVNPHLFDQLEAQKPVLDKKQHKHKSRRKLVFDCVSECVESKCRVWVRGLAAVRRKDQLVEHVCDKISRWEQMKDCMVDELVDKDMSSGQHKKWLDFEFEAFEIGVEIEGRLLGFLIDEAIVDILVP